MVYRTDLAKFPLRVRHAVSRSCRKKQSRWRLHSWTRISFGSPASSSCQGFETTRSIHRVSDTSFTSPDLFFRSRRRNNKDGTAVMPKGFVPLSEGIKKACTRIL